MLYPQELTTLPAVFTPNQLNPQFTPPTFKNILHNFESKKFCYEFDTSAFLLQLVSSVFKHWKSENLLTLVRPLFKERHEKIKTLLDYVSQHYAEELSPMYAAQLCCTSYSNFCKLFKHAMGTSFTIFLNNYRINEAKKLLLTSDLPIKEIALQVGFDSCSYFIKLFRKRNDISPSLFRKTMKNPLKDMITSDNLIEY